MRILDRIHFITELLTVRKRNLIMILIMMSVIFIMIDSIGSLYFSKNNGYRRFCDFFQDDIEDLYRVEFQMTYDEDQFTDEEGQMIDLLSYVQSIENMEGVSQVLRYGSLVRPVSAFLENDDYISMMKKTDLSNQPEAVIQKYYTNIVCADSSMLKELGLEKEEKKLNISKEDNVYPAYLGAKFKKLYKVGDKILYSSRSGSYIQVVGFFSEGLQLPDSGAPSLNYEKYFDMDVSVLICLDDTFDVDYYTNGLYVKFQDESKQDCINRIKDLAGEYEQNVSVKSLDHELQIARQEQELIEKYYIRLLIFLLMLAWLTILVAQYTQLKLINRRLAIWMAYGISKNQIMGMLMVSEFLKILLPLGIMNLYSTYAFEGYSEQYLQIHRDYMVPILSAFGFIIFISIIAFQYFSLRRIKISNLLKKED